MNIERGYLFITDITGYTEFLTQSELDHAKEILDALFDSILRHLDPPMVISGTQGDAIVCYFPENAFAQPQSIIEGMEHIYYDFQRQLSLMDLNTTCTCKACANMTTLDLKVFLHYGQYMLQQIGDRWDLQGADIILIHRLMKNKVKEKFGTTGYGLITKAAIDAMNITGLTDGMHEHTEQVEHFDDVDMFIYDLKKAWEAHRQTEQHMVNPEEATVVAEAFIPVSQWVAWDLSFKNDVKKRFLHVDEHKRVGDASTRIGTGSTFHCIHGGGQIEYVISDMEAPNFVTKHNTTENSITTYTYKPVEGGTLFTMIYKLMDPNLKFNETEKQELQKMGQSIVNMFAQIVDEEIAAERIKPEQLKEMVDMKSDFIRPGVERGRYAELVKDKS